VARGIAVLGFEATPKIWDITGSWLLVEEAGGTIETLQGSEPFPLETAMDFAGMDFPTLASATPQLASKAREQIHLRIPSQAQAKHNDISSDSM
jgi:myo-inositol-1(or 4)-monophosphatase